ncbi:DUF6268 family outer membrane beta-barrel protein [Termitidicoccus mucosus]|uniref:DUF6268 domain-containing protein n=1 Tax=Termitidicoccus mucosus TaxID=1184151 RepID=A0A178IG36_9BACT|nr:hypothetical protein AW736_09325 [Opitutaceae bacterium TSB47]
MKTTKSKYSALPDILESLRRPLLCVAIGGLAIPAAKAAEPQQGFSPDFDVTAKYSFSTNEDLERGAKVGEVEVSHVEVEAGMSFRLFEGWRFRTGVFASRSDLELTGVVPLPDQLEAVGLSLSATKFFGGEDEDNWRATLIIRPGIFWDGSGSSSDGFNASTLLSVGKRYSPTLAWDVGVRFYPDSKDEVLPVFGVRWDFHPDWMLSVGFPRTEVTYKLAPNWTLKGGLRFQGGTYHVGTALAPGLGDTYLEYREMRVGGGFEWRINDSLSVNLDGGLVVDRRFDYFDRGYELKGDSTAYFSIGISARF